MEKEKNEWRNSSRIEDIFKTEENLSIIDITCMEFYVLNLFLYIYKIIKFSLLKFPIIIHSYRFF